MKDESDQADDLSAGSPTPFERFENFAKRLFAVPKREIDEQRSKDERGPKVGNGAEPKTKVP